MTEDISSLSQIIGTETLEPVLNRKQRREQSLFEKNKTKTQLIQQIRKLQAYLYEVVNNPESEFAKSIVEGVKLHKEIM